MYFTGITLNVLSLSGLSLGIGMLVDRKAIYMVGSGRLQHDAEGFTLTGCDGQLHYTQAPLTSYSLYADYYWYEIADCIYIGDSEVDIQTAKRAGMLAVGCSWGYRSREVLEEAGADVIVDTPAELLALFASFNAPKDEHPQKFNEQL